jgi:outer membrane protein assembly factor BamB
MLKSMVIVLACCLLAAGATAGESWPNLHGPANNSHSDAVELPVTFSETENVVWKSVIHDMGWSSPVVEGNQVWVTTATEDGKQSFALCLDRATGKIVHDLKLWETAEPEQARPYNSYASPTPVIEGAFIYVHFGSFGTACLERATGKMVWSRRDLPCRHYRGPGSSPIIHGNLLIMQFDGYDYQYAIALDKRTGKTVWKKDREVDYGTDNGDLMKAFYTPAIFDAAGRPQLISPTSKACLALDPATGEELWRIRYNGFSGAARPMFAHGLVYINGGQPKGELFAVRPDGAGDVTESHVVWSARRSLPAMSSPLVAGDLIFSIDDTGVATCIEAKTGNYVWEKRIGGSHSASPLLADGRIYLCNYDGNVNVLAASRDFRHLAENSLDSAIHASPAVAGKALFIRTEKQLYRIERMPAGR